MSNNLIANVMWGRSPERKAINKRVSSPGEGEEGPREAIQSPGGTFRHPDEIAVADVVAQASMEIGEQFKDTKSSTQQEHMVMEYFQFCQHVYKDDPYKFTLNGDRANRFMLYQALREQKPKGGTKESRAATRAGIYFDHADYESVMKKVKDAPSCPVTGRKIYPAPKRPPGAASFNGYKAILKKIFKVQVSRNVQRLPWEHIWQVQLDELHRHVKERKHIVKRQNYDEKINNEFQPYAIVERYGEIEETLWKESTSSNRRSRVKDFRHRYCVLHLTSGLLRTESLHRAELSDFQGFFIPKLDHDVHAPYVMVNQIVKGKTTHGKMQYGRATRHKDVRLCCIGALAFYLMYRFLCTGKFANMSMEEWKDNTSWFDVKLLIDVQNGDPKKEMRNDTYGKHLKSILILLGMACNKILHLGRNLGAKILDLLQEEESSIDAMGQWAQTIRRTCYSSQLPLGPMKRMAGFEDGKFYMLTRGAVQPPDELRRMTPIGEWCYKTLEELKATSQPGEYKTAIRFLYFMADLNDVWLQDCAAIMVLHPERAQHPMYEDFSLFNTLAWERFRDQMRNELQTESIPFNLALENVLPGLQALQGANLSAVNAINNKVDGMVATVNQISDRIHGGLLRSESQKLLREDLANSLVSVARDLLRNDGTAGMTDKNSGQGSKSWTNPLEDSDIIAQVATLTGTAPESPPAIVPISPNQSDLNPKAACHANFKMRINYNSLSDVYNQWYGLEEFKDDFGGMDGRNKMFQSKWRSHLNAMQYSRVKRTVEAIEAFAGQSNITPTEACDALSAAFDASRKSPGNFVKYCQQHNLLPKQKDRGRKRKHNEL